MKIFLLLLTTLSFTYAAHIDEFASKAGYLRDFTTALEIAKKQKKMVMLLVVADYCPWCKKFERKTLQTSEVDAKVKENFIPVVIDKYKDTYPQEFKSPVIPSVFFIDPTTKKPLMSTVAYMKKKEFISNINDALGFFEVENK